MKTSQRGLELIKHFEGCKLTAYHDMAGVLTIGWGHTGPDVVHGLTISQGVADMLLREDLEQHERTVEKLVKVALTQGQFDALVSFDYNTGRLSTSTMLRVLNQGLYPSAGAEFTRWIYAGGRQTHGLVNRRDAERALFDGCQLFAPDDGPHGAD